MKQNYANNNRKSSRIKEYDYSQEGLFFITICTNKRSCLFGHIKDSIMYLNDAGRMINQEWLKIAERFSNIILHNYVIMPNHFHAIIQKSLPFMPTVLNNNGQPQGIAPTAAPESIGQIIGAFKSITTFKYIQGVNQYGWTAFEKRLWQRNYWERVIRSEKSFIALSNYIMYNPIEWKKDQLHIL